MGKVLDISGQQFGRLIAIKFISFINGKAVWECRCDCGKFCTVRAGDLKSGRTKSCGCLNREMAISRLDAMHKGNIKFQDPKMSSAHSKFLNSYSDGNLTFEKFLELSAMNCFYCGETPKQICNTYSLYNSEERRINGDFIYNGLDRVDSFGKHDVKNVVPCCGRCNSAKRERSKEVYLSWINNLFNNLKLKGIIK